jgi:nitrogen fixation NifU-like protein
MIVREEYVPIDAVVTELSEWLKTDGKADSITISGSREKERMVDEMDDFVKNLQTQIFNEARAEYGEVAFQRWLKPLYVGAMHDADGYGRVTGTCGDTMEIFLRFENDRVKDATFQTDGCGSSTVCGSFAAELAHGKGPEEITDITGERILAVLGGLPEEDRHCAFLASEALQEALDDYMRNGRKRDHPE